MYLKPLLKKVIVSKNISEILKQCFEKKKKFLLYVYVICIRTYLTYQ